MKTTQCIVDGCERGGKLIRGLCSSHYQRAMYRGELDLFPIVRPQPGLTCSIDDCDRTAHARGLCVMHYRRLEIHGTTDLHVTVRPSTADRLAAGLVLMPSGCLEWTGASSRGYGCMKVNGTNEATHRLAWTLVNGPIPDGLHVLHHCDNPPCAQTSPTEGYPDGHLFLGTAADNIADMDIKGRRGTI